MDKLKEIDNFMKFFPQKHLEEDEPSGKNKKRKSFEFLKKNGNGVRASTVNEINQKVNEKMSKIRAPKKEKKKKQRGKIKIHDEKSQTQNKKEELK